MGRKMIETCNHCGKKEARVLLPYETNFMGKMRCWLPHNGKRYLLCPGCEAELSRRQHEAKSNEQLKQIRLDFIAECKEDTDNA